MVPASRSFTIEVAATMDPFRIRQQTEYSGYDKPRADQAGIVEISSGEARHAAVADIGYRRSA